MTVRCLFGVHKAKTDAHMRLQSYSPAITGKCIDLERAGGPTMKALAGPGGACAGIGLLPR